MEQWLDNFLRAIFGGERIPGAATSVEFNPPTWMGGSPRYINAILIVLALAVVVWAYRRDGRRLGARIGLGILRGAILLYVIALINQPVLRIVKTLDIPSVVAVMVDTSVSANIRDTKDAASLALPDSDRAASAPASPGASPGIASGAPATNPSAFGPLATQASVAAAGTDDSLEKIGGTGPTRLDVAVGLLTGEQQQFIRRLGAVHALRFYQFSRDASALGGTPAPPPANAARPELSPPPDSKLVEAIRSLKAEGTATQLAPSLLTVLSDLQGQQVAGVVVITDARDTPVSVPPAVVDRLKKFGVKVFAVPVGTEQPIRNLAVTALNVQESAFKGDLVSAKVSVRASGYDGDKPVRVVLKNRADNQVLRDDVGRPAEATVTLSNDRPQDVEIVFQPKDVGTLDLLAEVAPEEGELSVRDNSVRNSVAVLDAQVNLLYVDGYPRWEYRYIKNEMIRDKTVNISCLLTSADTQFAQEGDRPVPDYGPADPRTGEKFPGPITRFPETAEELGKYDVVLFGDVDPRQFTDRQLQLLTNFVSTEAGGFGMVAGPQHAPVSYRNTALEAVLPVQLTNVQPESEDQTYRDGWRPVITDEGRRGEAAMMFRFFTEKEKNDKYLQEDLQPLFWFSRGISAKSGIGLVYAEHPVATDPTGRKAPLLVLGRFGAGRTLFNAIDDSWRWRYYTGESVFDTYWVQQIRYLARGRKLAERGIKFAVEKERYERGDTVKVTLTVLSPKLLAELPPQIRVDVVNDADQLVHQEVLLRQESPENLYTASFPATDRFGAYRIKLPALSQTVLEQDRPFQIIVPQQELDRPTMDRANLLRLTPADLIVPALQARDRLPQMITSAAVIKEQPFTRPLLDNSWDLKLGSHTFAIPRVIAIFMLLLTTEWVFRKVFGML